MDGHGFACWFRARRARSVTDTRTRVSRSQLAPLGALRLTLVRCPRDVRRVENRDFGGFFSDPREYGKTNTFGPFLDPFLTIPGSPPGSRVPTLSDPFPGGDSGIVKNRSKNGPKVLVFPYSRGSSKNPPKSRVFDFPTSVGTIFHPRSARTTHLCQRSPPHGVEPITSFRS